MQKRFRYCLIAVLLITSWANAALAAGLSMYPALLQGQASPGASGSFPGYKIANGTSAPFKIIMSVQPDPASPYLQPPASWFGFTPQEFVLDPGEEKTVELLVSIPSDAAPGNYETLIQAKAQGMTQAAMNINLALNARLRLSVSEPGSAQVPDDKPIYEPAKPEVPVVISKSIVADSETMVTTADGSLTVVVPPDSGNGQIRVTTLMWSTQVDTTTGYRPLSLPYKVEVGEGETVADLSEHYRMAFVLPSEQGTDQDSVYLCSWDDVFGGWIALPTAVDGDRNTASSEADKPGTFAVMHRPDLPRLTDINGHRCQAQILGMVSRGVVNGDENNLFWPESQVTRAQFAKMISIALGLTQNPDAQNATLEFRDEIPMWARPHVSASVQAGLFQGDDNRCFNSNAVISRQEMAVVLARAVPSTNEVDEGILSGYSDVDQIQSWAADAVAVVTAKRLMGDSPIGAFDPTGPVNRGEACDFLVRLLSTVNVGR